MATGPKRSRKDLRLSEEEPKRKNERKRKREEDSKRKRQDTKKHGDDGTAAGNVGVKFDAGSKGKLAKNRPDKTGGSPKRSRKDPRLSEEEPKRKNERKRKREEDSKRKRQDTKSKATTEPENTAGNVGVKFDAGSKGKLAKNQEEPKRKKQGKESANIILAEISFPACTKTVLQK